MSRCLHAFTNVPSSGYPLCMQCRESVYFLLDAAERQILEQQARIVELEHQGASRPDLRKEDNEALHAEKDYKIECQNTYIATLEEKVTKLEREVSKAREEVNEMVDSYWKLVRETDTHYQQAEEITHALGDTKGNAKAAGVLHARITANPHIMGGKPTIRGTRLTVEHITECLTSGMSPEEITQEYAITLQDVSAAIAFDLTGRRKHQQRLHEVSQILQQFQGE